MKAIRQFVLAFISIAITAAAYGQSAQSKLEFDPSFNYSVTIPYIQYQNAVDIQLSNSFELTGFQLTDGDGSGNDADGNPTVITSITFGISTKIAGGASVPGSPDLRRLALYSNVTNEIIDQAYSGGPTITFDGLSITALDNFATRFSVRATFNSIGISDHDQIQLQVVEITQPGSNSSLLNPVGQTIGGNLSGSVVTGSSPTPSNRNIIQVIATKLDFTTQPNPIAGINEPILTGAAQARDQFGFTDVDFNSVATVTAPSAVVYGTFMFNNGILNSGGSTMYGTPGDGTLIINTPGLTSIANDVVDGIPNVSVPCQHVDVIQTAAVFSGGGVISPAVFQNILSGSTNKVLFGITFSAPYSISGQPTLQNFSISFGNSTNNVLSNFKVYESTSNIFQGSTQIPGAFVTQVNSQRLTIDLSSSPRHLDINSYTYFLVADINPLVSGSTPAIQAYVIDDGFGYSTSSNVNTSVGSNSCNVLGPTYTFASISPPTMVGSSPAKGQGNVDPNLSVISLNFSVPVFTLDRQVQLHDALTGNFISLPAINGQYPDADPFFIGANPLQFSVPPGFLVPNQTYYITIAPADFNQLTGLMDYNKNLFPGFTASTDLFFKTSSLTAPSLLGQSTTPSVADPIVTDLSPVGGIIQATFDQKGMAYFIVTSHGSPAPTNSQILGTPYAGALARGSFPITQTYPISQSGIIYPISTNFAAGVTYDLWMMSQSDATPTPIFTSAPYGGTAASFVAGGTGPTLSFIGQPVNSSISVNNPSITLCSNSFQVINQPIIISEGGSGNFSASGSKTLSLSLPAGFQFDTSMDGSNPTYGYATLIGEDFIGGPPSMYFVGNSILSITFNNWGSTSSDRIVLSGFRIKGTSGSSGSLLRFGGSALPMILDATSLATITTIDANPVPFGNSYSESLGVIGPIDQEISYIPDNFNSGNPVHLNYFPPIGDFGYGIFSGAGVDGTSLSLNSQTLNVPFPVTLIYTDQNGCISTNSIQYEVYDHLNAIPISGGQGPFYVINPNYILGQSMRPPVGETPELLKSIPYNTKSSFYLEYISATVPSNQGLTIFSNPNWTPIVNSLPQRVNSYFINSLLLSDYSLDFSKILDAKSISGGALPDPYSYFLATTPQGNLFVTGGSLGVIELTGNFRSIANPALKVPFKQNVELYIPPLPTIDIITPYSSLDINDPNNPVPINYDPNNKGTTVFCTNGGLISFKGYPIPSPSNGTTGQFSLIDQSTGQQIITQGLVNSGFGQASLDPTLLGSYLGHNLQISYAYQINNVQGAFAGRQIIRIVGNPVADFNLSAVLSDNTPLATSICSGHPINFDGSGSHSDGASGNIVSYNWNFGDVNSAQNTATSATAIHNFSNPGTHIVWLVVKSEFGCTSPVFYINLDVGSVPTPSFIIRGTSSTDIFSALNTTLDSGDPISKLNWDFGDGNTASILSNFNYPISRFYLPNITTSITLQVTSVAGCVGSLSKPLVVLDSRSVSGSPYFEDFESSPGSWITLNEPNSVSSWAWGIPGSGKTVLAPELSKLGLTSQHAWTTGSNGKYNVNEKSYLLSPKINFTPGTTLYVSFNQSHDLAVNDGIALQYSLDNLNVLDPLKVWTTLGVPFNGANWYDAFALQSNPGNQNIGEYGWTGQKSWDRSGYLFSPPLYNSSVVFRFALSSINTTTRDGMIIDNFRVGTDSGKPVITATKTMTDINLAKNDTLKFSVSEDAALRNLKFFYKNVSATRWDSVDFSAGIKTSSHLIAFAQAAVKDFTHKEVTVSFDHNFYDKMGIKYYVSASDLTNQSSHTDTTKFLVKFTNTATSPPIPVIKFGGSPSDWRMFSIPYILDDNSIAGIFESKLGAPSSTTWRLLQWDNSASSFDGYKESGSLSTIDRGKGYWFNAVGGLNRDLLIGKGTAPDISTNLFVMSLKKGWNQIGNPYPVSITWPDVLTFNHSNSTEMLKKYTGGSELASGTFLDPYEGAYVFSDVDVDFKIPVAGNSGGRIADVDSGSGWSIDLTIRKDEWTNTINGIGMNEHASDQKDRLDGMRVPRFSDYVDLTFPHQEYFFPYFAKDIVAEKENHVWEFYASTNTNAGPAELHWDQSQVSAIDADKELWLYDVDHERVVDLKETETYGFSIEDKVSFKMLYGSSEFIKANMTSEKVFVGDNFPNPFNKQTTIPLVLPGNGESFHVNFDLYDNTGRLVAPLQEAVMTSGFHQIEINRSSLSMPLTAGLYLLQTRVQGTGTSATVVKKLVVY